MPADQGVAFRATSGYVTDPSNVTYNLDEAYPTVRGGITCGWQSALGQSRDRDSSVSNKRLAGIVFRKSTDSSYFQIDLDATGSTDIHAAFGDAGSANDTKWIIKDTTTNIITLGGTSTAQLHFFDGSGVERTSVADWTTNEAATTYSMASTALRITANSANNNTVAFFRSVQSGGGGGITGPLIRFKHLGGGGALVGGRLVGH